MSLAKIYGALVVNDQTLPGDLQMAIATWCTSRPGSEPILANLVRRTDLDPRVEAFAASIDDAKVKGAWLSRPGRSPEELSKLIAREKRASVLIAVAESENTSTALIDAMSRDNRITVAEAVIRSPKASDEALLATLPRILSGPRTHVVGALAGRKLREVVHLHNRLAKLVDANGAVHLIATPGLDADSVRRLVELLVETPLVSAMHLVQSDPSRFANDNRYYRDPLRNSLTNAVRRCESLIEQKACSPSMLKRSSEAWFAIVAACGDKAKNLPDVSETLGMWLNAAAGESDALTELEVVRAQRSDLISTAAQTEEPEALRALCQLALHQHDTELLDALTSNPALQASMLPSEFGWNDRVTPMLEPLLRRSADPSGDEALVRLGAHSVERSSTPETLLDNLDGIDPAFARAVLAKAADHIAPWRLTRLLNDVRYKDILTANLGMASLASLLEIEPSVANTLVPLLVDRFGSDPAAWEIFHKLADDYSGSVAGLVHAAAALVD